MKLWTAKYPEEPWSLEQGRRSPGAHPNGQLEEQEEQEAQEEQEEKGVW